MYFIILFYVYLYLVKKALFVIFIKIYWGNIVK